MLIFLDEKSLRSEEDIEQEYKDCMFLIRDYTDLQDTYGYLYCVSTSKESYHEICRKAKELEDQNIPCIFTGSYKDSSGSGLVYEIADVTVN